MPDKILIIEDDSSIAQIEKDFLEIEGFEITVLNDGEAGLKEALTDSYSLILLDLMLPGLDGWNLCKQIRGEINIPILMVTAKKEDADKILGLGLGADDYITKPFSPSELVVRVKANLAQYARITSRLKALTAETAPVGGQEVVVKGDIEIHTGSRRVYVRGREVECANKEYELLLYLISRPDMVFSKEALYERIWGSETYGDIKTVAVHINRLREKIEENPSDPEYIQTVWGAGYRFSRPPQA